MGCLQQHHKTTWRHAFSPTRHKKKGRPFHSMTSHWFGCMEILFLKLAALLFLAFLKNTLALILIEATIDPLTAVLDGMKVLLLKLYQMPILVKNTLPNQSLLILSIYKSHKKKKKKIEVLQLYNKLPNGILCILLWYTTTNVVCHVS